MLSCSLSSNQVLVSKKAPGVSTAFSPRFEPLSMSFAAVAAAGADDAPSPPVWPGRFHAMMSQVMQSDYGVVDLW